MATGEVVAGATYAGAITAAEKQGLAPDRLRIIAKGQRVSHDAYVARPGFPPAAVDALAQALSEVSTRDAAGRQVLAHLRHINGFMLVDDTHYDGIRAIATGVTNALTASRP